MRAAERRQRIARGVSPGLYIGKPRRGDRLVPWRQLRLLMAAICRPSGLGCFFTGVPGAHVFRIRRSVTESYQDIGNTSGADTGRTTAVVRPVSRSISRMYMCR